MIIVVGSKTSGLEDGTPLSFLSHYRLAFTINIRIYIPNIYGKLMR